MLYFFSCESYGEHFKKSNISLKLIVCKFIYYIIVIFHIWSSTNFFWWILALQFWVVPNPPPLSLSVSGRITKRPENPLYASVGASVKLDWRFTYSQPFDYLVWQKIGPPGEPSGTPPQPKVLIGTVLGSSGRGGSETKFLPKGEIFAHLFFFGIIF